jgi:hypothetical protein
MSKQWDRDWQEREAQRRAKTDRLMQMVRGDLDRRDVDRDLERAKRRHAKDAPTFSECVIGYRHWTVDALDQLWPMSVAHRPWEPGVNTAVCDHGAHMGLYFVSSGYANPPKNHKAPHEKCECGLYAWRRLDPSWGSAAPQDGALVGPHMPPVLGAVAFWGEVRVHRIGFRAEHACIVALAYRPDERAEVYCVLERVAARYRVDLVPYAELEASASGHGSPLPDYLRPPAPQWAQQWQQYFAPGAIFPSGGPQWFTTITTSNSGP